MSSEVERAGESQSLSFINPLMLVLPVMSPTFIADINQPSAVSGAALLRMPVPARLVQRAATLAALTSAAVPSNGSAKECVEHSSCFV